MLPREPNRRTVTFTMVWQCRGRPGRFVITIPEPRLVIALRPTRRDHLHGAWWPYSTDIDRELAPLLSAVAARFRLVLGVTLNRDEWPGAALTQQPAHTGKAKISWYGLAEAHLAVLYCSDQRRLALLVLPPDTAEQIALTAILMASAPGNGLTANETLARARAQANTAKPH